jgi:hypothetical protein
VFKKKRNKYGNTFTWVDGIRFHSKKEAARYEVLRAEEAANLILHLKLQPSFPIRIGGYLICRYIADFQYVRDGVTIVEDVKGRLTDVYKLKRKLMKACYNIDILET